MSNGRGRTGAKVRYDWQGSFGEITSLAGSAIVGFLLAVADKAETIRRTRGEILILFEGAGLVDEDACVVGWGLMVMPSGAVAGGVTVGPITNSNSDWFAYGMVPLKAVGATEEAPLGTMSARIDIDSKAMRRLRESDEVVLVLENGDVTGSPAVQAVFGIRILTGE